MTKQEFQELVNKGTVLLDGATGSNLMRAGMPRGVYRTVDMRESRASFRAAEGL